jgi:Protein of unknown function (DUF1761)
MLLMCVNFWAVLGSAAATMVIGFLWYSPFLFAKPWMLAMGYDPDDKARIAEMQKKAGPMYAISFLAQHAERICAGKGHLSPCYLNPVVRHEGRLRGLDGLCDDGAADRQAFWQPPSETLSDQHGYQLVCYLAMGAILGKWVGC